MYTIRLSDGQEFGPAEMALIERWARENRIPNDAVLVSEDGSTRSIMDEPAIARVLNAPPTIVPAGPVETDGPALIPTRNPHALIGYYLSIVALFPFVGAIVGPVAVGLGISGLRRVKANPRIRGTAHAWVAIILGALASIGNLLCVGSAIMSLIANGP